jgi:CRP-like cAMP-binding protein
MQAFSTCRVLELSPTTFRRIAQSDARNMWPLFNELASVLTDAQGVLSQNLFQPVRARVARHMLDLAVSRSGDLVVDASQQDIADAIGSVREVVSRIVVKLRDDGFLRRANGVYVIVNPAALHLISEYE